MNIGRQGYEQDYYFVNDAIYLVEIEQLPRQMSFFKEGRSVLYKMKPEHGLDVDEPMLLELADFWLARRQAEWLCKTLDFVHPGAQRVTPHTS